MLGQALLMSTTIQKADASRSLGPFSTTATPIFVTKEPADMGRTPYVLCFCRHFSENVRLQSFCQVVYVLGFVQ